MKEEIAGKKIKLGKQCPRQRRPDGFANRKLRSLTVAAYLRCLHGAVEYAPDVKHRALRTLAIEKIKEPAMFRTITQLCDATDWDEEACIGSKYLRVMRHVIKLPNSVDEEATDPRRLLHYQLLGIVLQKTLGNILTKMNKDIQLTPGDQIAQFEICLVFFIIINQSKNFSFSKHNLVRQHLLNEASIANMAQGTPGFTSFPPAPVDDATLYRESDSGPWPFKCKPKRNGELEWPCTLDNYDDFLPELREQRSP